MDTHLAFSRHHPLGISQHYLVWQIHMIQHAHSSRKQRSFWKQLPSGEPHFLASGVAIGTGVHQWHASGIMKRITFRPQVFFKQLCVLHNLPPLLMPGGRGFPGSQGGWDHNPKEPWVPASPPQPTNLIPPTYRNKKCTSISLLSPMEPRGLFVIVASVTNKILYLSKDLIHSVTHSFTQWTGGNMAYNLQWAS